MSRTKGNPSLHQSFITCKNSSGFGSFGSSREGELKRSPLKSTLVTSDELINTNNPWISFLENVTIEPSRAFIVTSFLGSRKMHAASAALLQCPHQANSFPASTAL